MILLGSREGCDGLVMSATGRRQEVVVLMLNIFLSTHFTDSPGEKEGLFSHEIGRKEGRRGWGSPGYREDLNSVSILEVF